MKPVLARVADQLLAQPNQRRLQKFREFIYSDRLNDMDPHGRETAILNEIQTLPDQDRLDAYREALLFKGQFSDWDCGEGLALLPEADRLQGFKLMVNSKTFEGIVESSEFSDVIVKAFTNLPEADRLLGYRAMLDSKGFKKLDSYERYIAFCWPLFYLPSEMRLAEYTAIIKSRLFETLDDEDRYKGLIYLMEDTDPSQDNLSAYHAMIKSKAYQSLSAQYIFYAFEVYLFTVPEEAQLGEFSAMINSDVFVNIEDDWRAEMAKAIAHFSEPNRLKAYEAMLASESYKTLSNSYKVAALSEALSHLSEQDAISERQVVIASDEFKAFDEVNQAKFMVNAYELGVNDALLLMPNDVNKSNITLLCHAYLQSASWLGRGSGRVGPARTNIAVLFNLDSGQIKFFNGNPTQKKLERLDTLREDIETQPKEGQPPAYSLVHLFTQVHLNCTLIAAMKKAVQLIPEISRHKSAIDAFGKTIDGLDTPVMLNGESITGRKYGELTRFASSDDLNVRVLAM